MKLHRISLTHFKGVNQRDIEFPNHGVTVVVGHNESGKSSLIEALDLLLDQKHSSKAKEARAARPEGQDVPVEVEAEITLDGQRVVYRKRWWKNPIAELQFITGPRAGQTLTGGQAHDAAQDLLRRSDPVLRRALRLLQTDQWSQNFRDSAALRKALESGGITVDEDSSAATVLEAARNERAKYFTPTGQEKKGTAELRDRYKQAVERHREARSRLGLITQAVEHYDHAIEEARHATEKVTQAQEELTTAETAETEVQTLRTERTQARQDVEQARLQVEHTRHELETRTALVHDLHTEHQRCADLEASVIQRQAEEQEHEQQADHARKHLAEVRHQELQARHDAQAARVEERRAADHARLAELTTVLEQLDALHHEVAQVAPHEPSGITAEQLEAIESAQRAVDMAQSQLDAGSAHVTVNAVRSGVRVTVDGSPAVLDPHEPLQRAVTEPLTVQVPDHVHIVVEPESGLRDRKAKVQAAQDHCASLLTTAGVSSVQQAREALERDIEHKRHLASLEQRQALILRERSETDLRQEADSLNAILAATERQESADNTAEDLRHAAAQAESRLQDIQTAALRGDHALRQIERTAQHAQVALAEARAQWESAQHICSSLEKRLADARQKFSDESLAEAHTTANAQFDQFDQRLTRAENAWVAHDADGILQRAAGYRKRLASAQQHLEAARATRSRAEGILDGMNRDSVQRELDDSWTDLRVIAGQLTAHLRRAAAAKLLADTLEKFQAEAHRRYNAPFRQQLELLGRAVFGPTFEVELSDDLIITRRRLHGTWLDVTALSTGAQEQLNVLVRLAVASLVDPEEGVPVILDDALGHSDPVRLISLAAALESVGSTVQVIVLTATPDRFAALQPAHVVRLQATDPPGEPTPGRPRPTRVLGR